MCTIPIPTGKSFVYVSAIISIFMVKIMVGGLRQLYLLKFGHFAIFEIIYAKTVMYTIPIPTGTSFAYVSAIHTISFMVKIVVGGLRQLFIFKIRSFCNICNNLCKNRDVYHSNSNWKVFCIRFCNFKYFYGENHGRRPTVAISFKIRSFCNICNNLCKNRDVYPSNSNWKAFGVRFCNTQYFFYCENRGRRPTVAIYF